jgi:uncharacterized membrane protein YsdA (DUF1294 family)/cold shock CspA family protein
MRQKGRITEWQDERGFGFITPMSGGERVFVHIKSFAKRARRPVGNELVTFDLTRDPKGRLQGVDVRFSGGRAKPSNAPRPGPGAGALVSTAAFLVLVSAAALGGRLPIVLVGAYLAVSAVTFVVYALDKSAARNDRWRTPEATLHSLSLLGGWPGALLAQKVLRHKSSKRPFRTVFWVTVALNLAALVWLLGNPNALSALDALIR